MTNYTFKELGAATGIAAITAKMYLSRSEFSHVVFKRGRCENVTDEDILRIKELAKPRATTPWVY